MTLDQCIARSDSLRPNSATEEEKARWVLELEGELNRVFFPRYEDPSPVADWPRSWPEDRAKTLSASGPFEGMYVYRLLAWLDLTDQELESYNAHRAVADELEDAFKKAWHKGHRLRGAG